MPAATKEAEAPIYQNIYDALAAFQSEPPSLTKGSTATVPTKSGGSYSYTYADLSVLVDAILPALGRRGIAWVCVPTMEDGKFVLKYGLFHGKSDTSIEGTYMLPERGTPQEIGSAITYARRYTLLSLTGTFPAGEDDDGQKAAEAHHRQSARQARGEQPPAPPAPPADPDAPLVADSDRIAAVDTIDGLREVYTEASKAQQLDRFTSTGESVRDAINARRVQIVAASKVAPAPAPTGEAALDGMGTPVDPDAPAE